MTDTIETPEAPVRKPQMQYVRYAAAKKKRADFLELVKGGTSLSEARSIVGWAEGSYRHARNLHRDWAAEVSAAIYGGFRVKGYSGSIAEFSREFFRMDMAWFHILYLELLAKMPPGNILMAIFPPEHGKTSMFENYCNMQLALNPEYRIIVAGANERLAKKIIGRVKLRMAPTGPTAGYVRHFGPFEPQHGTANRLPQTWNTTEFNVYKKSTSDERDYSMCALGVTGELIGSRCEHLHVDDPQSTKTLGKDGARTPDIMRWFRQDALSRPGETGKTTIAATRVGDGDFVGELMDDQELIDKGIMQILKFPALYENKTTGELEPLWKEKYTMEQLERIKVKSGQAIWDTQYMMVPGLSEKKRRTFVGVIEPCYNNDLTYGAPAAGRYCYLSVDPALGGRNCVQGWELTPDKHFRLRYMQERTGLRQNEEIIVEIEDAHRFITAHGAKVTKLVIEDKNFQAGLQRDQRLMAWCRKHGITAVGHNCVDEQTEILTADGWKRHDELGVGDPILTLDIGTQTTEWLPVESIYRGHHVGKMARFKSRNIDALCTPDHRWPAATQFHRELQMVETQNLNTGHVLPLARRSTHDPAPVHDDRLVELVGWCVTEGNFREAGTCIVLSQSRFSHPQHLARIQTILDETGADWFVKEQRANGVDVMSLKGDVARRVRAVTDNRKHIPPSFIMELSAAQRALLLKTMIDADGWMDGATANFCSNDEPLITAVEMLAAMDGRPTYRTTRKDARHHFVLSIKASSDTYLQNVATRATWEEFDGLVWCPHTRNGTFVARRNGVVYLTGNTGNNKYDPDVGVPSMATSFIQRVIELPYKDIGDTRAKTEGLRAQFHAWRPGVKGTQLRQDQVMTAWFAWVQWQENWREPPKRDEDMWTRQGLTFSQSLTSGLVLPIGVR